MIILKILLWIILAVLGIILLILILPAKVQISFIDNKFTYKIKYWLLPIYGSDKKGIAAKFLERRKKNKTPEDETAKEEENKSESETEEDISAAEKTYAENSPESSDSSENTEVCEKADDTDETFEDGESTEPKSKTRKNKKSEKDDTGNKSSGSEEKSNESSLGDKIEFLLEIWDAADRPILKIFKGIKLSELYIDFIIANEDAYKCALNYGKISAALYRLLGWLSTLMNVKFKTVDVNAGFALEKSRWDFSVNIGFSLMTVVIAGLWFLITYIFKIFIPKKMQKKKSAARQK